MTTKLMIARADGVSGRGWWWVTMRFACRLPTVL
jgi:hypothetical protein